MYITTKNHENYENVCRMVVPFELGLLGLRTSALIARSNSVIFCSLFHGATVSNAF